MAGVGCDRSAVSKHDIIDPYNAVGQVEYERLDRLTSELWIDGGTAGGAALAWRTAKIAFGGGRG